MSDPTAIYYDGLTARRRIVALGLAASDIVIAQDSMTLSRWPYSGLREQDAPPGVLRLACTTAPELARLEIADVNLSAKIRRRAPTMDHVHRALGKNKLRIVGWSVAAALSLVLTAVYLMPLAADRITPLVPQAVETWIGESVESQVQAMFGGGACDGAEGLAALAVLQSHLLAGAPVDLAIDLRVLPSPIANAFALPGGHIYVLGGLLKTAANAEEVAGVLAHEMGHVAHRDGLRRLIQSSGSSFLIGLLFGDVVGGGTLIALGQTLVNSAYSREQESAADAFAAELFLRIGQSPKALGTFLTRLTKTQPSNAFDSLRFLQSHPLSAERLAALSTREPASPAAPLLNAAQWQALKNICPVPPAKDTAEPGE